ncbi:exported hypothetical protein [Xanthomonas citri pv. fuscans]|nr:exported hypothetical protein [Xanthomonas citri pv. fuscans]SOO00335.1 exported hypothetical protein [Xanthomonas citri pv. fuscans]SOO01391.1 exported hypothetical protein [Xanthomonas citri pv. fuscans]SOO09955.1 exported hypothetical protein [Xanthomonas citri pv. fuscans]SOO13931.1 exported hypothetical protein [Xanthomonas citri pv. fuscans]
MATSRRLPPALELFMSVSALRGLAPLVLAVSASLAHAAAPTSPTHRFPAFTCSVSAAYAWPPCSTVAWH